MQRDFFGYGNDRFGVALDGLLDKRNAVGFEATSRSEIAVARDQIGREGPVTGPELPEQISIFR